MRFKSVTIFTLIISLLFPVALFAANPKAGTKCSKLGQAQVFANKKFTCVKSGKILIWNKGLDIPKPNISQLQPNSNTLQSTNNLKKQENTDFLESKKIVSADECKLKDARIHKTNPNNVGFPLTPDIFPSAGEMKLIVVPVDFSDAIGDDKNLNLIESQILALKNWYAFVSDGKITVKVQFVKKWFRAKSPSSDYSSETPVVNGSTNFMDQWNKYAQEFIDITGNTFDFNEANGIIWHFPDSQKTKINNELVGRGIPLATPSGTKNLFYWASGNILYEMEKRNGDKTPDFWASLWVHELLHSQGLPLHAPGNGFEAGVGQNQSGASWILDGWETFKMGWISDEDLFCISKDSGQNTQIKLQPLEIMGKGNKLGILKLSDTRAIVIESRRPVGYSKAWEPTLEGIFVYLVDVTKDNDRSKECCGDSGNDPDIEKWAYFLPPDGVSINNKLSQPGLYKKYLFKPGEKINFEGFEINYVGKDSQDFVRITKL